MPRIESARTLIAALALPFLALNVGCFWQSKKGILVPPPPGVIPAEMTKVALPLYVIEAPDLLLIEVYADSGDVTKPPIALWPQPISGQHVLNMDGTVRLGIWGSVPLTGLTLDQAADAIRQHVYRRTQTDKRIADKFKVDTPEKLLVVVDVLAYNSKTYFIITDGAGFGETINSFAIMGGETVLDALARVNGLPDIASKRDIWIARRSPVPGMPEQILPIDYVGITQHAVAQTNYQVMPGDRIYVQAEKIFRFDRTLQKVLTPIERLLGITLLGSSTVNSISGQNLNNNNNGFNP
jgi:polysaccharide export outer membrane protein